MWQEGWSHGTKNRQGILGEHCSNKELGKDGWFDWQDYCFLPEVAAIALQPSLMK